MKRFAVFGYGYNPNIPTCFVFAASMSEACEAARIRLDGITVAVRVIEWCEVY